VVYSILFSDDEFYESPGDSGGWNGSPGGWGGKEHRGGTSGMGQDGSGNSQQERPDGKRILRRISQETGGRFFEVSKKQPIDKIYSQIEEELRNQYSLGYSPGADPGAGYHKISLTTKQKSQIVQTRQGYYVDQSAF